MPDDLYPLRFEPILKTVVWGGTALRTFLGAAPSSDPTGEAWMLSDQGDNPSRIANGPLTGTTLRQLLQERQTDVLGSAATSNGRFPLLLKLLDARENLSVQVHPNDEQARRMESASAGLGKTEAWVILRAEPGSRVYAGLREGVTRDDFQLALKSGSLPDVLHAYEPRVGDCIFLEAGTVHAIGAGLKLFEVQQTSDITYRLYDWGRVDATTKQPRQLHIEQAMACTNYERGPCDPVTPQRDSGRERLVACRYFTLDRISATRPYSVGAPNACRIVVCTGGKGSIVAGDWSEPLRPGSTLLIPAAVGVCDVIPSEAITMLECGTS